MKSTFDLKGKVIVVTGGAGALGREFISGIAQSGGIAISADIQVDPNQELNGPTPEGGSSHPIAMDITSKKSINEVISMLDQKYGRIDAIVNNAYPRNKNYGRHFFDVDYEDFCTNVNTHLGGYFLCSQQFSNYFRAHGGGQVVNISSIYGLIAPDFDIYKGTSMTMPVEYAAIKSAVIHLTKYMARYLQDYNIRVNCLSPGGILDRQPQAFLDQYKKRCVTKGMLDRQDVVGSLLFLLSEHAQYINGQNLVVDDGFTL